MSDERYEPTNRLRWYQESDIFDAELQQWWCLPDDGSTTGHLNKAVGEWRDVPTETP